MAPTNPTQGRGEMARADVNTIVVGTLLAMFLAALDQTIVAPALPPIAADLGDFDLLSWVVTAYLLSSICASSVAGKLSDLYGRRRTLRACMLVFIAGSALCALAPSMVALILARVLQGLGGGALIPLCQTIIGDVVSPRERGRYAAWFSMVWATASVAGPTLGGLLTEYAGWPLIFWINLPIGGAALLIADRALARLPVDRRRPAIDYASVALLSLGTIALLLVLSLGGTRLAWTGPEVLALAAAALVLGVLFVRQQTRAAEPIVPPHFARDGVIQPVLAASFLIYGTYIAAIVQAPIYFQVALGASASEAGLLMIPMMLSSTVTANMAGRYMQRRGRYKLPSLLGLPAAGLGLALLAVLAGNVSAFWAAAILTVVGFGIGPTFPSTTVAIQNAVERHDLGAVSSALAFARSLGGSVFVAIAAALLLGLVAVALPGLGELASIEDLARRPLTPEARREVAWSFGWTFGVMAVTLLGGLMLFARAEDRTLRSRIDGPARKDADAGA